MGRVDEIPPGEKRIVPVGRNGVGVFNVKGRFYALNNICPHAGAPLCFGDVTGTTEARGPYEPEWVREGEILRCPWHAWEIDITSGRTLTEPHRTVRTYEVVVEDDVVILEI